MQQNILPQTVQSQSAALEKALLDWASLSSSELFELVDRFQVRQVAPREMVVRPGDEVYELYFVSQGLLRFYYLSAEGKETNKAFVTEGEFAGPIASAELALPLYFGVEALEPTIMLTLPIAEFKGMYDRTPAYERLGRRLAEYLLVRKELRMRSLLEQTAKERYLNFLLTHAHLVDRVPQYHLASYLGITEVSLSRIKSDLR